MTNESFNDHNPKKYSALRITTSRHLGQNEYSLKINVFFYLKARRFSELQNSIFYIDF